MKKTHHGRDNSCSFFPYHHISLSKIKYCHEVWFGVIFLDPCFLVHQIGKPPSTWVHVSIRGDPEIVVSGPNSCCTEQRFDDSIARLGTKTWMEEIQLKTTVWL